MTNKLSTPASAAWALSVAVSVIFVAISLSDIFHKPAELSITCESGATFKMVGNSSVSTRHLESITCDFLSTDPIDKEDDS